MIKKAIFAIMCAASISAQAITINADDYAPGTNITNLISGITLTQYSHANHASSISYAPAVVISHLNLTGDNSLSDSITNTGLYRYLTDNPNNDPLDFYADFSGLNVAFDSADAEMVSFYGWGGADDLLVLAFDSNDTLIRFDSNSAQQNTEVFFDHDYTGEGVRRLMVGSFAAGAKLQTMSISGAYTVPEPTTLALLALGIIAIFVSRKLATQSSPAIA